MSAFAFFDVDGTLISLKSMLSFQEYWYAANSDRYRHEAFEADMARLARSSVSREEMNRRYYAHFAGRRVADVARAGVQWFEQIERTTRNLFHYPVVARMRRLQGQEIEPVLVSGSFPQILGPIARRLGVRHVLSTTMAVHNGLFTGEILDPQTIGRGKAQAIERFLASNDARAADCHAYGDDISDLPMLESVGHPGAVEGDPRLEALARDAGWEILATA